MILTIAFPVIHTLLLNFILTLPYHVLHILPFSMIPTLLYLSLVFHFLGTLFHNLFVIPTLCIISYDPYCIILYDLYSILSYDPYSIIFYDSLLHLF